ncbi:MAG: hypothetical protein JWM31_940, partial [Solirubrobacterales bacterium]|nr:hypothetical protein [Solirubrobacterales bacterium]
ARAGTLSGATGAADLVANVDALRAVLHRALRTGADAEVAADTGDRLAHVCSVVAALALDALVVPVPGTPVDPAPPSRHKDPAQAPAPAGEARPRGPLAVVPEPVVPPETAGRPVTAQDLRPDAPHLTALRAAIDDRARHPVTLLAIELDDLERQSHLEGEAELVAALGPAEAALSAAVGAQDVLVRDGPGRWWVLAPRQGTDAARRLAQRLSDVFGASAPVRHDVPLRASIGVAVFPDDGSDAATILEHADQGVFTARALGVPVA